jgi:uncharacterized protein YbaP (TraB family)
MSRLIPIFFLFLSLLSADDLPKPVKPAPQGIVFKVAGGKAPMYLCGSIHLMQKQDFPLPEAYETAFKQSQRLVMEVPPEDMDPLAMQPVLMKYALLKEGSLEDQLEPATYKALQAWAKEKEVPLAGLAKFQPWLVAITITQQAYEAFGMKADRGIDVYFKNRLEQEKKTGSGLETMDDQFRLLSGFSLKIQDQMILQSITEAKEADAELTKLLQAWRAGDTAAIAKTMEESFAEVPEVGKLLLQDRNARWVPKVKQLLTEATPTMVLVGAGHLCGKDSLVELLQKEGFVITQVKSEQAVQAGK